jgi:hypothetical protein
MKNAKAVLLVKFSSTLSPEDLQKTCLEDLEDFRNVPGLLQKYYLGEENTGAISGFYIFESENARSAFWNSKLAKSIPARYGGIVDSFRVEQYELLIELNELQLA